MYVQEFTAAGALTSDLAEQLQTRAAQFSSRVTFSSGARTVEAPLLALCWRELGIRPGSTVTISAAGGRYPPDAEDARALADLAGYFQARCR